MTNSLSLFEKHGLINSNISYSEIANAFLTVGYTSNAGNTYFNSIRVAEGILIKESVGHGWYHNFLNGIEIYSIKDKVLLADKNFHKVHHSKSTVKNQAKLMLLKVLKKAAKKEGYYFNKKKAKKIIRKVLDQAMQEDQRELLRIQTQKYLSA